MFVASASELALNVMVQLPSTDVITIDAALLGSVRVIADEPAETVPAARSHVLCVVMTAVPTPRAPNVIGQPPVWLNVMFAPPVTERAELAGLPVVPFTVDVLHEITKLPIVNVVDCVLAAVKAVPAGEIVAAAEPAITARTAMAAVVD